MELDYRNNSIEVKKFNKEELKNLIESLIPKNIKVFLIDENDEVRTKSDLLNAISKACNFPGYFGFNWDALRDCINDFSFNEGSGYLFIFNNSDTLKQNLGNDFNTFCDIYDEACERWKDEGVFFKVFLL